jgi:hypothetical protein
MKKSTFKILFLFLVLTSLSFSGLKAQKIYFWLDAGVKLSGGSGMLYNNNLINDRSIDPAFASIYGFGGKFGFNFGQYHAITLDGMYSLVSQTNSLVDDGIPLTTKKVSFNSVDLFGMYRYNRNLNYVELGVKYSIYQRFLQTVDGGTAQDVDELFVDNMISPVLGFGYYMFNADAFTANLGFRLSYGVSDILSSAGIQTAAFTSPIEYDSYSATNPAFIEVVLELNFGLGQYAKSVCGKRASFMSL